MSQKGAIILLRAYPLPSLTLVVLFPSRIYNLQIASVFSPSLLPDLSKTGNHPKVVSSALRASSECEGEDEHSDDVAVLILTLTREKPQAAWKEFGNMERSDIP
jgi:hypothetical protein